MLLAAQVTVSLRRVHFRRKTMDSSKQIVKLQWKIWKLRFRIIYNISNINFFEEYPYECLLCLVIKYF